MTDAIKDLVESLLKNAMVSFDTMANNACDKLQNGVSDSLWNTVSHLTGVFTPFCNIIIGICILLELANIASNAQTGKPENPCKYKKNPAAVETARFFYWWRRRELNPRPKAL